MECPNHHHATAPVPSDAPIRRLVDGWIAQHRAQMHEQHERWGTDDEM